MLNFKYWISAINRIRKRKFPSRYVSQKKFNNLKLKYTTLVNSIASTENPLTKSAKIKSIISYSPKIKNKELCLFLSHSPQPAIKPHVKKHIENLIKKDIPVVLIINTDNSKNTNFTQDIKELSGLYTRENIGFDFGAWSDIYNHLEEKIDVDKLYLINDSIVGPISEDSFNEMIDKIRASSADFIGLTSNSEPEFHIQSFFLVLGKKVLNDEFFKKFFQSLWNLPTKEMVIDFYETKMTSIILKLGYKISVIYDTSDLIFEKTDSSIHNPKELIDRGFPYKKLSIIKNFSNFIPKKP